MHGRKRSRPLKSHHFGTPHIEDKEGNIVGVGNRQGVRIEGRGVVFDRSSKEQSDIEFSELKPRQQRKVTRKKNRKERKEGRRERRAQRRASRDE
tara:strand:+ start:2674 stop:2958 length:285 start_codon:yes stop_codon:yes gene_type:complete